MEKFLIKVRISLLCIGTLSTLALAETAAQVNFPVGDSGFLMTELIKPKLKVINPIPIKAGDFTTPLGRQCHLVTKDRKAEEYSIPGGTVLQVRKSKEILYNDDFDRSWCHHLNVDDAYCRRYYEQTKAVWLQMTKAVTAKTNVEAIACFSFDVEEEMHPRVPTISEFKQDISKTLVEID